ARDRPEPLIFTAWLAALKREVGIPARLGEAGVTPGHVPALVAVAIKDTCHQTNPRKCTAADFERLFAAAL
ncbi:MAG TPA: iron-containing alcohol dehydrogenase, partial [Usitatibacteraceae bacterium]|nr:iron-containing alcohol dehydrogenase [Usitatibacteraceae bacterium]